MQALTFFRVPSHLHARPSEVFKVLTLCEDLETARIAWRAFDAIQHECDGYNFKHELLFFEILQHPGMVEAALLEMDAPDFILVSFRNDKPCPLDARLLVREWARQLNHNRTVNVIAATGSLEVELDHASVPQNNAITSTKGIEESPKATATLKLFWAPPKPEINRRNPLMRIFNANRRSHELEETAFETNQPNNDVLSSMTEDNDDPCAGWNKRLMKNIHRQLAIFASVTLLTLTSYAGTVFYAPVPPTESDNGSGISTKNVYTSAVNAGGADIDVNGVTLHALSGSGKTSTSDNVTISTDTGMLINGGGKSDNIKADGSLADALSSMIFNNDAANNSEQYVVLDPVSLKAGRTYDLRVYVCNTSGENRMVNLSFVGDGKASVETDFFNEDDATTSPGGFVDPNQVYYINYRYKWDGESTPGVTITQKNGHAPFCLYALTNQQVTGDVAGEPARPLEKRRTVSRPAPVAEAPADNDVGVASNDFYEAPALKKHGKWVDVEGYGNSWQPTDVPEDWAPYTNGAWVSSDEDGMVWNGEDEFGWATDHYGRWTRLIGRGWVWVPGRVWAPAWVSWRYGGSYVGWAPLPPEAQWTNDIGISTWADSVYGVGPLNYNFVDVGRFGERNVRNVIIDRSQNTTIINKTTNITNITNNNNKIYNSGPNIKTVNSIITKSGGKPIPTVKVDHKVNGAGKPATLKDGVLSVTSPTVKPTKNPTVKVADKIKSPKTDLGWQGVKDPKLANDLKAHIAKETAGQSGKPTPSPSGTIPGTHIAKPGVKLTPTNVTQPEESIKKPGKPGKKAIGESGLKPGQPVTTTGEDVRKPGKAMKTTTGDTAATTGSTVESVHKPGKAPKKTGETMPSSTGQTTGPVGEPVHKPGKTPKTNTGDTTTTSGQPATTEAVHKPTKTTKKTTGETVPKSGQTSDQTGEPVHKTKTKKTAGDSGLTSGQPMGPTGEPVHKTGKSTKSSGETVHKPASTTTGSAGPRPTPPPVKTKQQTVTQKQPVVQKAPPPPKQPVVQKAPAPPKPVPQPPKAPAQTAGAPKKGKPTPVPGTK